MSLRPYPAYRDSGVPWLGQVPAGWAVVPVKAIASCNDDVLPETTPPDEVIEYVEISDVEEGRGVIQRTAMTFAEAPSRARRKVQAGDVIVSTVRTYLRAIATIPEDCDRLVVSTGFAVFRPRRVLASFLGYAFRTEFLVAQIIARSVGVSYPAINASEVARLPIPLPPPAEQRAIAAFLDRECGKIDALVAEQERLIALLKEKRQAVISHAVTKGLDPSAPMKDSGVPWLGQVPRHWTVAPLKHVASFAGGGTPSREVPAYWNGDVPWVSPKDMKSDVIRDSEERITEAGLAAGAASLIQPNAVLIVVRSGILRHTIPVAINDRPVALNQDMKAIRLDERRCEPRFILRLVQGLNDLFVNLWLKQGATVESIEHEYLAGTAIPLPPPAEQRAIAAFLDRECGKIDALVTEAERAIALLKERRAALISAAVTGRIDVRGLAPAEEAKAA